VFISEIATRMQQKEIAWCDGVPYVVIGRQIMQCCYGKQRQTGCAVDVCFISLLLYAFASFIVLRCSYFAFTNTHSRRKQCCILTNNLALRCTFIQYVICN